uniref:Uncharacterized protein n=1 Tax=Anopheles minimus TaxID=112268 RepID=A0A182WNB7_9DIPT
MSIGRAICRLHPTDIILFSRFAH